MQLVIQVIPGEGETQTLAIDSDRTEISALAGMTYRIIDPANPNAVVSATIRKDGDDMIIDLLSVGKSVVIQDYYFVCRFDFRSCVVDLEPFGGGPGETLSAENIATSRVPGGTLIVWRTGSPSAAVPSAPALAD